MEESRIVFPAVEGWGYHDHRFNVAVCDHMVDDFLQFLALAGAAEDEILVFPAAVHQIKHIILLRGIGRVVTVRKINIQLLLIHSAG
ncbi:hypothetical protein D3C81_1578420 [compost metagenome]